MNTLPILQRPDFCAQCPIGKYTTGYTPLKLRPGNSIAIGEASGDSEVQSGEGFSGGSGRVLWGLTSRAGLPKEQCSTLNVIGCHPPQNIYPDSNDWKFTSREEALAGIEYCKTHHMWPSLREANRDRIIAVGAQALEALTGKHGIHTWRGSPLPLRAEDGSLSRTPRVLPIIHPANLMRQAKYFNPTQWDLRKALRIPPENYNLFPSIEDVRRFTSTKFSLDFEWNIMGISLAGFSDKFYNALVVPFIDPYIDEIKRIIENATYLIGHNLIGAELLWIEKLGWKLREDCTIEDTMLKQHLVQPDLPHALDFVASVFTNKVFWKGHGWEELDEEHEGDEAPGQQWRTWDRADALPRELGGYKGCLSAKEAFNLYNARDTDAGFQIDTPLSALLAKWDLESVYRNVSLPAGFIARWMSQGGLRVDTPRLTEVRAEIVQKVADMEVRLPKGLAPYNIEVPANLKAPDGTWRAKTLICKGRKGSSHEGVGVVFNEPSDQPCPACGRLINSGKMGVVKIVKGTKTKRIVPYNSSAKITEYVKSIGAREVINRKTGRATTGKQAQGIWVKEHPEFALLGALKKQVTLRNNFAKEGLLKLDRMFFNFKVHGTSEGRFSATGQRRGIDMQPQNIPNAMRRLFIPDQPDWGFVNIDISQGESWLTCWLAQDWTRWAKLQTKGYDEHSELASEIFQREVNKKLAKDDPAIDALRQIGKKTNHASSYGMGYKKFYEILVSEGYDQYTEQDAKTFLEAWRKLNAPTVVWQKRTRQLMERQGYLRNPFGRIRWFTSRESATQCLAFLPASTLADMVIRMMICHYPDRFYDQIQANGQQVYRPLVKDWRMSLMVHDSLVLQGPWESREEQQDRSVAIMTQEFAELTSEMGTFHFNVDIKSSQESWGACA